VNADLDHTAQLASRVLDAVDQAVVGKRSSVELVLLGILAGGHVLIEDLPGLGKTLIARSLAQVLGLEFTRLQFTPDLLPSDVTGAPMWDQASATLRFRPGPVFTNLLLADEINRTPPRTQSALLEAMAERQVSVDGVSHPLPEPFVVLATDNPIEYEGTFPLPEAQLDRFSLRVRIGYLDEAGEAALVRRRLDRGAERAELPTLASAADVVAMTKAVEQVEVHDDVLGYLVAIVGATRRHPSVTVGASPRGALALTQLSRARAALRGRDFVTPDDVKLLAGPALAHRLSVRPELWVRGVGGDDVVADLLTQVPVPPTVPGRESG
jgi:MoxR-like ATPase